MYLIRKKDVLQELAIALYLTQQFNPDITAASVMIRVRERAAAALEAARPYTGVIGDKEMREFLAIQPLRFTIDCGNDIIKGDTIRFTEQVFNNKLNPPRQVGIRGVIAEVLGTLTIAGKQMLHLRVISSGGTWSLKPDAGIRRTLRIVTRMEVMRTAWEDEARREQIKNDKGQAKPQLKNAKVQLLRRDKKTKSK